MELTKERKVYLAILATAGAVLAADQLLSTGPRSADASERASEPADTPPAAADDPVADQSPPASEPVGSENVLADWNERARHALDAVRSDDGAPDAADALNPPSRPDQAAQPADPADGFARRHRLTAILVGEGRGVAMIDGRPVRVGESLDGLVLVALEDRAAVFEHEGERLRLELPTAQGRGNP